MGGRYQLVDSTIASQKDKDEASLFDGIDTSLGSLRRIRRAQSPRGAEKRARGRRRAGGARAEGVRHAGDAATAAPAENGLAALRALRASLGSMGLDDAAKFEIDFRLKTEERDWEDAVLAAHQLVFEALAGDGLVIAGQPLRISLLVVNRGAGEVTVADASVSGFDGSAACTPGAIRKDAFFSCTADVRIPQNARLTAPYWTDEYWRTKPPKLALDIFEPDVPFGAPFRPTPFRAAFRIRAGAVEVTREIGVQYRYNKDILVGEKRMALNVVPAFSVSVSPTTAAVPMPPRAAAAAKPTEREVHVSVVNGTKGAAQAKVSLELPAGWKAAPPEAPVGFLNEDEALSVRFVVSVPAAVKEGEYRLRAVVTSTATGAERFAKGYREIDYPHIERRQVIDPAETAFKVMDVKVTPDIRLGYVVGAGDEVPAALEQLGARVDFIEPDVLAWGDLSRYE